MARSRQPWVVALSLVVMATVWMAAAQDNIIFTDEEAGEHIDYLTHKGIQLLLKWRANFLGRLNNLTATLDWVESTLTNQYSAANMPNITAYVQSKLSPIQTLLNTAEASANALNLTASNQTTIAFMKTPTVTVNAGGGYDSTNRASGTFTVPMKGLYLITFKDNFGYHNIDAMRNGNVTLCSSTNDMAYYASPGRQCIRWLNPGDQIFLTGFNPPYFGVKLLRTYYLMPEFA